MPKQAIESGHTSAAMSRGTTARLKITARHVSNGHGGFGERDMYAT